MSSNEVVLRKQLHALELGKTWYWFFIAGLVMLVGGIIALANPFAASITIELITGWTFIFAGVINLIQTFRAHGAGAKLWTLGLGVLALLLGISLLANPMAGVLSLTVVVAVLIALSGVSKLIYGFKLRPSNGWLWLAISGIVSIILAGLIFSNFAGAALITLGVMLAIELISSGTLLVLIGFSLKQLKQA